MSTPEQTLLDTLRQDASVSALCGGRVYPDRAPEDAVTPFAVFTREATGQMQTLSVLIDNPDVTFDVRCWADTRAKAEQLATAIQTACADAKMGIETRESGYSDDFALHAAILKIVLD